MRIGIITDIHNNLIALESVLSEIEASCDYILCSGDVIGIGPYPEETVQRLMQMKNLIAIRGNHEGYLLDGLPAQYPNDEQMGMEEIAYHKWEHRQFTKSAVAFLKSLPYSRELKIAGKKIAVLHYAMNAENRYIRFKLKPNEEDLKAIFASVDADIIVYGHDHNSNICKSEKLYINAGSLGCPAGEKNIARYAILEITDGNVHAEAKKQTYDSQTVVNKINTYHYPAAEEIKRFFFGMES